MINLIPLRLHQLKNLFSFGPVSLKLSVSKMSVFGVILVHIFPAFSRILVEYGEIPVSLRIESEWGKLREKCGPE